jgi:hypothetical protein
MTGGNELRNHQTPPEAEAAGCKIASLRRSSFMRFREAKEARTQSYVRISSSVVSEILPPYVDPTWPD